MKKMSLLIMMVFGTCLFSQEVLQDFEDGGLAGSFGGSSASIVADPQVGGTRGMVAMLTTNPGEVWQGINLVLKKDVELMTNKTMQIDVYSLSPFAIAPKVLGGLSGAPASTSEVVHTGSGWETLTVTFDKNYDGTAPANGVYHEFVIYQNWNATTHNFLSPVVPRTFYVDNIKGIAVIPVMDPMPTTAAPTPPGRPTADVKSIFSDAYTPIAVLNYAGVDGQPSNDNTYNTSWCPGMTSLIQVAGNNTNKITGLGCEGVSFLSGRFDASSFTHFHMDIWTPTATMDKSFNIKFSNWNGGTGEANAIEYSVNNSNLLPSTNPGTWISLDIPLSSFTGASRNDLVQFIITSDLGIVYYDNLYLHKNTLGVNDTKANKAIRIYPNPVTAGEMITADANVKNIEIFTMTGQKVKSVAAKVISSQGLEKGVYVIKCINEKGEVQSSKLIIK